MENEKNEAMTPMTPGEVYNLRRSTSYRARAQARSTQTTNQVTHSRILLTGQRNFMKCLMIVKFAELSAIRVKNCDNTRKIRNNRRVLLIRRDNRQRNNR